MSRQAGKKNPAEGGIVKYFKKIASPPLAVHKIKIRRNEVLFLLFLLLLKNENTKQVLKQ